MNEVIKVLSNYHSYCKENSSEILALYKGLK